MELEYFDNSFDNLDILFYNNEKFGWPTAILFLAPAEGWKGPSGPAGAVFLSLR